MDHPEQPDRITSINQALEQVNLKEMKTQSFRAGMKFANMLRFSRP
jgi:hypothetical protein